MQVGLHFGRAKREVSRRRARPSHVPAWRSQTAAGRLPGRVPQPGRPRSAYHPWQRHGGHAAYGACGSTKANRNPRARARRHRCRSLGSDARATSPARRLRRQQKGQSLRQPAPPCLLIMTIALTDLVQEVDSRDKACGEERVAQLGCALHAAVDNWRADGLRFQPRPCCFWPGGQIASMKFPIRDVGPCGGAITAAAKHRPAEMDAGHRGSATEAKAPGALPRRLRRLAMGPAATRRVELKPAAGGAARALVRPDTRQSPRFCLAATIRRSARPSCNGVCASMPRARPLSDRTIFASP